MKILALLAPLFLFEVVYCKNAWDTEASRRDAEMSEEKRSKTSIIVYDKNQMSAEDIDAEVERIKNKCNERLKGILKCHTLIEFSSKEYSCAFVIRTDAHKKSAALFKNLSIVEFVACTRGTNACPKPINN